MTIILMQTDYFFTILEYIVSVTEKFIREQVEIT